MDGGAPPKPDAADDDAGEKEALSIGEEMQWKLTAEF